MLIDPAALRWQVINDDVMGGCSASSVALANGRLHFRGELSTANGGGFASIRAELGAPWAAFSGLRLSVSGDGRRYQVRLRENPHSEATAWRALFEARVAEESVVFTPDDFEAVIRGRRVETLPGLRDRSIRYLGFMLTSKQPGPFALTVHRIETVERDA
jgi:NADH dehydrogenase [ubiquinone] 1 alpha subcomplex assembly factor 1